MDQPEQELMTEVGQIEEKTANTIAEVVQLPAFLDDAKTDPNSDIDRGNITG